MPHLWVREIKKQRIARSETIALGNDVIAALGSLCAKLDIPRPLWLEKHTREWEQFGQTSFSKDHFMESVSFDRLEIESFDPDAKKKKSRDPRNA
ncbi:MAG: hypothetical protein FWF69_02655 [Firmicutes bacterium]|nr:hypothetical protein [Bacillota bacterium]